MKQAEDDKTVDMFEVLEKYTPKSSKYRFYIRLTSGEEVEWTGLSLSVAKAMYRYTDKTMPSNVTGCGWEEIR